MKTAIYAFIFAGVLAVGSLVASPKPETSNTPTSADCKCGDKCATCCGTTCSTCTMHCCSK